MNEFMKYVEKYCSEEQAVENTRKEQPKNNVNWNKLEQALGRFGVPYRLRHDVCSSERAQNSLMLAAKKFVGNEPCVLTLSGKTGSGKSFAGAYFLALYIHKHNLVNSASTIACWHNANDLMWIDRKEFRDMWKLPVLILDDFPPRHESESKFSRSQFFTLISHRYDDMLKTIITTNKAFKTFKEQWADDALARRMFPPNGLWVETSKKWSEQ